MHVKHSAHLVELPVGDPARHELRDRDVWSVERHAQDRDPVGVASAQPCLRDGVQDQADAESYGGDLTSGQAGEERVELFG